MQILPEYTGWDVETGVVGSEQTVEFFPAVGLLTAGVEEVAFHGFDPEIEVSWGVLEAFRAVVGVEAEFLQGNCHC